MHLRAGKIAGTHRERGAPTTHYGALSDVTRARGHDAYPTTRFVPRFLLSVVARAMRCSAGAVVTSAVGFGFALMRNAEASGGHRFEAIVADRVAARLARAVRPVIEA